MAFKGRRKIKKGISMGLFAPRIEKLGAPKNSERAAGFVGKNVSRCQSVNQYQTALTAIVRSGIRSIFICGFCPRTVEASCDLYFHAM